ncbi:MAG: hypothetical protein V2A66_05950 [Pseudomonadota bacterium]
MKFCKETVASAVFLAAICAGAARAEAGSPVVVFASEKIMGEWVGSYLGSIAVGTAQPNECELAVGRALEAAAITVSVAPEGEARRRAARGLNTVFGRYGDVSTLPNDIAVKAAFVVDPRAAAVVACGVQIFASKSKAGAVCAGAGCKAIDTKTRRRVATAAGERCVDDKNSGPRDITAIRDVCGEMGEAIAGKLR